MAATIGKLFLLLCFVYMSPVVRAQSDELVCPNQILVTVTTSGLEFEEFPPDYEVQSDVDYDPGAVGPWYAIAEGIINTVRPGSVTEGKKARETGRPTKTTLSLTLCRKLMCLYTHV